MLLEQILLFINFQLLVYQSSFLVQADVSRNLCVLVCFSILEQLELLAAEDVMSMLYLLKFDIEDLVVLLTDQLAPLVLHRSAYFSLCALDLVCSGLRLLLLEVKFPLFLFCFNFLTYMQHCVINF